MIKVNNLKKTYGETVLVTAINDVSFLINEGEFVGLMGRSGSGKSTLLRQLGLLDVPSSGSILIDNVDVLKLSEEERTYFRLSKLGYVFQEYGLIAEFSALENVLFPSMAINDIDGLHKAKELLSFVGLDDRFDHYPNEMSGGEQQRVAIARALINDPKIIFADEPTANLDSIGTEMVLSLFKKLNKDLKKTIVMVTHEQNDRFILDRVITLKDGKISDDSFVNNLENNENIKSSKVLRGAF